MQKVLAERVLECVRQSVNMLGKESDSETKLRDAASLHSRKPETLHILAFEAGLSLYHGTLIRSERNDKMAEDNYDGEQLLYYKSLQFGEYMNDLEHGKWFSLSPQHPFFYFKGNLSSDSVALHYKTTKPLILLDINHKTAIFDDQLGKCFDGYIAFDDNDDWREVFLKRPSDYMTANVEKIYQITDKDKKTLQELGMRDIYPFGDIELDSLQEKLRACYQVDVLTTVDADYTAKSIFVGSPKQMPVSECAAPTLKKFTRSSK